MHTASQADGVSKMKPLGEVTFTVTRGSYSLPLEAIVVEELDCDILGGMPFLKANKILIDIPNDTLILNGKHKLCYKDKAGKASQLEESKSFLLRTCKAEVLWPGDYAEFEVPPEFRDGEMVAVEPRIE